jgi:enoyl-CoA hydratase/carnithine racemase
VKLGLIPGWGGTQRLPRIVGYEPAAEMIASGKSLSAQQACDAQLASAVVQSDALVEFAAKFVTHPGWQELRDSNRGPVPYHQEFMPMVVSDPAAVREAMVLLQRTVALTLAEGLPLESEVFCRLVGSPTSRRMIDEFFASRKKS